MKNKNIILIAALGMFSLLSLDLYSQELNTQDSLKIASEQEAVVQKAKNEKRMDDVKRERKQTKEKAKEARSVSKDAESAARESRNAVRSEKKAQKSRRKANKQADKASKARKKSDDN